MTTFNLKKMGLVCLMIAFGSRSWAFAVPKNFSHDATAQEILDSVANNESYHSNPHTSADPQPLRPVEDTANMAYVLMSELEETSEVRFLRQTIAKNLPAGVKLVILTESGDENSVRKEYGPWIAADRLIVVSDKNTDSGFWARDSFPYPVYSSDKKDVSLIGHKYYRPFSSGPAIAKAIAPTSYRPQGFTFVGGNLLADEDGNCFSINSYRLFTVTPQDLTTSYGCKKVNIMNHVAGIGDADEVLKPLSGHRMLTNAPEYKSQLESLGYQVIMLPAIPNSYRTYANSLIIKDTVFMPSYGVSTDKAAAAVYEGLGYKVFMIPSNDLSDEMHGSVHCQSMAYPAMSEAQLIKAIKDR